MEVDLVLLQRPGPSTFHPTSHVGGAWNIEEQHIAPALGLVVHAVDRDRDARRADGLVIGRLSYDILGTVRIEPCDIDLTAHLFRQPAGEWIGFDTAVSFGPTGLGLTISTLHDVSGPLGTQSQILTIRSL